MATAKQFPALETVRLRLRAFSIEDAPRVQELAGDYEVAKTTLNIPHPYEDGMAEQWISTHQKQFYHTEGITFCLELKQTAEVVGAMGLTTNTIHRRAELGYWIGQPFWGKGLCTEACRVVLDFGFSGLGLHRILAHHMRDNPASGKVMVKCGMRHEGTLQDHILKDGKFHTLETYAIVRG